MTVLPDGSAFFVADIDTFAANNVSENPIKWNQFNGVVQDHRDGTIDHEQTNIERAKRGLPVPWTPEIVDRPTRLYCCCCGKQALREGKPSRHDKYTTTLEGARAGFGPGEVFCGHCAEEMDENGLFPEEQAQAYGADFSPPT